MIDISPKQRRIVKAKIKGKSNKEIARDEYPTATERSQEVLVSRELNKTAVAQYYEQSKLQALKEHNITWSRIIKPISDGLNATKQNNFTGEITTDHNTRLSAAKQAMSLLEVKQMDNDTKEQLLNLPNNVDEIQLIKLIKNK
jgi:hypothetical protein